MDENVTGLVARDRETGLIDRFRPEYTRRIGLDGRERLYSIKKVTFSIQIPSFIHTNEAPRFVHASPYKINTKVLYFTECLDPYLDNNSCTLHQCWPDMMIDKWC